MASPFSVFRRNQKALLAISCLMAMVAFVFLDPLMRYLRPGRGGQNPVVVKTDSHSYHQMDLVMLIRSRQVVESFLQLVASDVVNKGVMSGQISSRDGNFYVSNLYEDWRRELLGRVVPPEDMPSSDDSEQGRHTAQEEAEAIQTMVLAERAEAQGLVISDQTVNDYLKSLTRNTLSGDEFQKIVSKLRADQGSVTQAFLFDALRRELLASRYNLMFRVAAKPLSPAPRWAYFQRMYRRATAEVLGVSVENFLKDVPEPKEADLLAFFDAHNQTLQVQGSPEPGFKQPTKAVFQYFKAKHSEFLEKAEKEVTTEEMQEYYEKNKDVRFRERQKPADDADNPPAAAGESTDATPKPDDGKPASTDKSTGTDKPEATKPDGGEKPAGDAEKTSPPADGDKKSSSTKPTSPFRVVALAQKSDDKTPAAASDGKAAPADGSSSVTPAPATPATGTPATETKPDGAAAPAADGAATDAATADSPAADASGEKKEQAKPEIKFEPFEKVEGEIRKILAGEKTNKAIDEIFARLGTKMRDYASARGRWEANKEDDDSLQAPEPLDLPALASAEGLTVNETDLVSAFELSEKYDIGKAFTYVYDQRTAYGYRQDPFVTIGFNERPFRAVTTQDNEGDRYLSWKVKETPSEVPSLDEVRQEVVHAYKMIDARKRATAAGEQLAKEARDAKKPLSEVFAGRDGTEVVNTGAFTWITMGAVPYDPGANQPRLSPVHGVDQAGEDFMKAVFDSSPDQIRVALNQPQTVAYVVQVQDFQPEQSDLERQFVVEEFRKYGRLAFDDEWELYLDWLRWLDKQAGLTWVNTETASRRAR